jgi:DNA (cytosine-5)-methyltransferase 1
MEEFGQTLAPLRHLDLFSGIGGFALAARMVAGIETVAFCECEPYAQAVLRRHWPHVPICNDIHELEGTEYGTIDIVTGGFPCQPYSVAGPRKGNDDDRALWPQMLRVIRQARPRWVVGENVPGIIPMALDGILDDLEATSYSCGAVVVPACAVGAIHRRDRVWIVAHSGGQRVSRGQSEPVQGQPQIPWREDGGGAQDLSRMPDLPASGLCRGSDGIPNRVDRTRAMGNAIVPQVAAEIFRLIKLIEAPNLNSR